MTFFVVCPTIVDDLEVEIMDIPYLLFLLEDWLASLHRNLAKTLLVSS